MSLEIETKRIADALEKISGTLEAQVKFLTEGGTVAKTKKKKAAKKIKDTANEEPAVEEPAVEETVSVDDLDGEVAEPESKFSAEDVKAAAKVLVDSGEGRSGFEKAQKIIKGLGAASLKTIVPGKYAEAIKLFGKAVAGWSK